MKFVFGMAVLVVFMEVVSQNPQDALDTEPTGMLSVQRRSIDPNEPLMQAFMELIMECLKRAIINFLGLNQADQADQTAAIESEIDPQPTMQ